MNPVTLLCRLLSLLIVVPLRAGVFPNPVITIEKVSLPKVTLRISNPDKTTEFRIWAQGNSWEEQNKWFSLRTAAGGKIVELHPKPRDYTKNTHTAQSIPAGGSLTFEYDLSDESYSGWVRPKDFVPGTWSFEVRAHLDIPREFLTHRYGVFAGKVASPWYNAQGREVESAGKPQPDKDETALESRTDFPWERLNASLQEWDAPTPPGDKTMVEFFGADFPWDGIQACYYKGNEGYILTILLPERGVLMFRFRSQQPALKPFKQRYEGFSDLSGRIWIDAKPLLLLARAKQVQSIALITGDPASRAAFGSASFKRAFDAKGRLDRKAAEELYMWHMW
ncbi:MAG TPA: hypothetical protein VG796_26115 [Verrucomicrobiales bacterium]|jgi:hypothetical protein|nr:hypothetical protein [Verrucomicrobiales bacterium]